MTPTYKRALPMKPTDRIWISTSGDNEDVREFGRTLAGEILRRGGSVVFGTDSKELLGVDAADPLGAYTDPDGNMERWWCYLPTVEHYHFDDEEVGKLKSRPEAFVLLDPHGDSIPEDLWGSDEWKHSREFPDGSSEGQLTKARETIAKESTALVAIGGNPNIFPRPGVAEEVILMLHKPTVLVPDFGGVAGMLALLHGGKDLDEIFGDEGRDIIPEGMYEFLDLRIKGRTDRVSSLQDEPGPHTVEDVVEALESLLYPPDTASSPVDESAGEGEEDE